MSPRASVVIVDDLKEDRYFLRRAIKKVFPDIGLREFAYAEDALAYLRSPDREPLALLLVDINMPRMNGFEFVDAFQQLYPELKGNARLYVMSGSIDPNDQERALRQPSVTGYLEKPVARDVLKSLM
ncbi:MAG: two-component system response regulator [Paracoccaceae bacterium]